MKNLDSHSRIVDEDHEFEFIRNLVFKYSASLIVTYLEGGIEINIVI